MHSGKFWPPLRRTEEKEMDDAEVDENETESAPSTLDSTGDPKESSPTAPSVATQEKPDDEDRTASPPPIALAHVHRRNLSSASQHRRPSIDDSAKGGQVPIASAFDIGRAYPTGKTETSTIQLPGIMSRSKTIRESSASRNLGNTKDLVANMPISTKPSIRRGNQHSRTPSGDVAARIEAHLDSVQASKYQPRSSSSAPRPAFLPIPLPGTTSRPKSGDSANASNNGLEHSPDSQQMSMLPPAPMHPPPPAPSSSPPNALSSHIRRQAPPPSRWSEDAWRDKTRVLGTLPLPSTTLSFSASRTLPIGIGQNRGQTARSASPDIHLPLSPPATFSPTRVPPLFRTSQQAGNAPSGLDRSRSLRM